MRAPTTGSTAGAVTVTSASGGAAIGGAGNCIIMEFKNASGNADIWLGYSGTGTAPYVSGATALLGSGIGFPLFGGESIALEVDQTNKIQACARTSGQVLFWMAQNR